MTKQQRDLVLILIIAAFASSGLCADESGAKSIETIFKEDQNDRKLMASERPFDWESIAYRDEEREKVVRGLIQEGKLKTGEDFYHAAMILQHGTSPEDHLLAHDLCVIAIGKGEDRAKWLAAASLDRYLVGIGRNQRYGTQFTSDRPFNPPRLAPIDKRFPDSLRAEMQVPTLKEAKNRENEMIKTFYENREVR